jgi:hypothetical protein
LDKWIVREEWLPVTILHALNNHVHCADVQMRGCTYRRSLLDRVEREEVEATLRPVSEQPYVHAALRAMQTHSDNGDIQYRALGVLEALTTKSATFNHIIKGGVLNLSFEHREYTSVYMMPLLF